MKFRIENKQATSVSKSEETLYTLRKEVLKKPVQKPDFREYGLTSYDLINELEKKKRKDLIIEMEERVKTTEASNRIKLPNKRPHVS